MGGQSDEKSRKNDVEKHVFFYFDFFLVFWLQEPSHDSVGGPGFVPKSVFFGVLVLLFFLNAIFLDFGWVLGRLGRPTWQSKSILGRFFGDAFFKFVWASML